jgi:hypothetical protein
MMWPVTQWKHLEAIHVIYAEFARVLISLELYSNNFCQLGINPIYTCNTLSFENPFVLGGVGTQIIWWCIHVVYFHTRFGYFKLKLDAEISMLFTFLSNVVTLSVWDSHSTDIWFVIWHCQWYLSERSGVNSLWRGLCTVSLMGSQNGCVCWNVYTSNKRPTFCKAQWNR